MIDPLSSKTIGYHLFFQPEGQVARELAEVIHQLSAEYGGPLFAPHVTLLARIPILDEREVIARSQSLADTLSPFTVVLDTIETKDAFFKALYLRVAESEIIKNYHAQANAIFSMQDEDAYTAHLSLLYGNYDQTRKEQTIANLKTPTGASFAADKIHLYRTEGEVSNWIKIKEFVLKP